MIALLISILLSLNLISSPAEYERMTTEEQELIYVINQDIIL
jgi:hypothetical protein